MHLNALVMLSIPLTLLKQINFYPSDLTMLKEFLCHINSKDLVESTPDPRPQDAFQTTPMLNLNQQSTYSTSVLFLDSSHS